MKPVHSGSNENKNSEKDLNKIEARFTEVEKKMNSLENKLQNFLNA